jgi:hypothetical protein
VRVAAKLGICVHRVTASPDVDTCCNGGYLNLATLVGCALSEDKQKAGNGSAQTQSFQVA